MSENKSVSSVVQVNSQNRIDGDENNTETKGYRKTPANFEQDLWDLFTAVHEYYVFQSEKLMPKDETEYLEIRGVHAFSESHLDLLKYKRRPESISRPSNCELVCNITEILRAPSLEELINSLQELKERYKDVDGKLIVEYDIDSDSDTLELELWCTRQLTEEEEKQEKKTKIARIQQLAAEIGVRAVIFEKEEDSGENDG